MKAAWNRARRLAAWCVLAGLAAVSPAAPKAPDSKPVPPPPNLKEVIVVFKTHFDIGYTDLASTIINNYRTKMIDKALDTCEKSAGLPPAQQFSWMVPGWPLQQILWPGQTPERRERLMKALRDGRIIYHAWPHTMQTESADPEDLVRGMVYSSDLARQLGQPLPRDAKMTDVPEHTWILPTIMKRAGIDFFHIGCNSGSHPPTVPTLFWWEGPDGSRLLTMYSATYGTELMPPADWPHRTWLCMKMTGDNHGPPTPKEVKALFAEAEKTMPGVKVRVGRLSDFYDAIMKENPQNIPVIRKDMPDTWNHGIMSMPPSTALARRVRPQIAALEALVTELNAWGVKTDSLAQSIRDAYEGSIMYSEHTWAMDYKKFPNRFGEDWKKALADGKYAKFLKSCDEHRDYLRPAAQLVNGEKGFRVQLPLLAKSVNVEGQRVVVFNPTPWRRSQAVSVAWRGGDVHQLKDAETGALVSVVRRYEASGAGAIHFQARDVPALGYRTYVPVRNAKAEPAEPAADAKANVIENNYLKVTVDPKKGGIASIVDKRTGRELVDQDSPHGFGQYLYEHFDDATVMKFINAYNRKDENGKMKSWIIGDFGKPNLPKDVPYAAAGATAAEVKITRDAHSESAVLTCPPRGIITDKTELTVTLDRDAPYVDVQWRIEKKKGDPWPEAGWICLPVKAQSPKFTLGRSGSIINPATDIVPASNHHNFIVSTGLTVTAPDGAGAGLSPIDSPLVSLGEPGMWKFDSEWTPGKPEVFVNLFNNMWGTNFPMWINGSWSSTVRVWSVEPGQSAEQALITPGLESRDSLMAAFADGPAGPLPPAQSGVELSRKGVMVTAFGPNPDGKGTILRLWEMAGQGGALNVKLPAGFTAAQAQPVDLRGRAAGKPLAVSAGALQVDLPAFAPLTLLFE